MKDILVHVDNGPRAEARIRVAARLAQRFGARLTGLFAQTDSNRAAMVARRSSDGLQAAMTAAQTQFATLTADLDSRWWQLPHGEPAFVAGETMFCARYFDLVVMGQNVPDDRQVPDDLVEEVVLNCGRPVLVLPYVGDYPTIGRRAVVAWNAGREAARVVHDALPLLAGAESVTVLTLRSVDTDPTDLAMPPVNIIDHLARQGLPVDGEMLPDEDIGKMDMLLSRACDLGADLLVMGAHGQYGLSRRRGSGTRYVLRHMTLPVLMSH